MKDYTLIKGVEKILGKTVISVEHLSNQYGVNQKLYSLISIDRDKYFMKYCRDNTLYEAEWYKELSVYLPVTEMVYQGYLDDQAVLIYKYKEGKLLTDILLESEDNNSDENFLKLERNKNKLLLNMYIKTKIEVDIDQYMKSKTNTLFQGRLFGNRYREYYLGKDLRLYELFFKEVSLNGKKLGRAIDVIKNIIKKYEFMPEMKIDAVLGHGDSHHQNIIYGCRGDLCFTDFEYSSYIPMAMELSKSYYIDLIGVLFFFFEDRLLHHFSFGKLRESQLDFSIRVKTYPSLRLAITEDKVQTFKNLLMTSKDPLTLNDYLVLSHLLSRDPNKYSRHSQELFIVLLILLSQFDPFNPKSLFEYFA